MGSRILKGTDATVSRTRVTRAPWLFLTRKPAITDGSNVARAQHKDANDGNPM